MKITTGRKILDYTIILFVVTLFLLVALYADNRKETLILHSVKVEILDDSSTSFVKEKDVQKVVKSLGLNRDSVLCKSVNIVKLKNKLLENPYINKVKSFVSYFGGTLYIVIEQFQPQFRIINNGRSYFVDEKGNCVSKNFVGAIDVPVVTNNYHIFKNLLTKKSVEKEVNLEKIITFVKYVNDDKFLNTLVTQINITKKGNVELICCVEGITVSLCKLDKLDDAPLIVYKLKAYLTDGREQGLVGKYKYIDLSHTNQIICVK